MRVLLQAAGLAITLWLAGCASTPGADVPSSRASGAEEPTTAATVPAGPPVVPSGPLTPITTVHATSLNRLDLWARSGPPGPVFPWKEPSFPIISGSDCAGEVAAIGPGVTNVRPGDRVVLYPSLFCGHCDYCRSGEQTQCLSYHIFGEHTPGRTDIWSAYEKARDHMPPGGGRAGIGTPEQITQNLAKFAESGVDQVIFVQQGGATSTPISARASTSSPAR